MTIKKESKDLVRSLFGNSIFELFKWWWFPVLLTTGGTIWATLTAMPPAIIACIAVFLLVIGWVMVGLYSGKSPPTNKEIEDTLREWIYELGWSLKKEKPNNDAYFIFNVEDPKGRVVNIARFKEFSSVIVVGAYIKMEDELFKKFQALEKRKRIKLVYELRLEIMKLGFQYDGLKDPPTDIKLFHAFVYNRSLTSFEFTNKIHLVNSATGVVLHWMKIALDDFD